ncbi:MAG: ATP-grasp domain-containing protein [Chitinophagaceae bacterium]|nr:ATP-grasp domain-containing protein [Chitinophagaceae bacterium]
MSALLNLFNSSVPIRHLKVWVLAPSINNPDPNLAYYYDFSQSIAEYTSVFTSLNIPWKWQPVSLDDYKDIIQEIVAESAGGNYFPLVLNLCDGDEINGAPGISVIKALEFENIVYTGAAFDFYEITTSKIPMKKAFDKAGIPTPKWVAINDTKFNAEEILRILGKPLIVKPAVSGGSLGVGVKNVVNDSNALNIQLDKMFEGFRGWNLVTDGIIAESFIEGPEYTVLIVGSYHQPEFAKIYPPVERVFHPSLPEQEKFLSFDRLWEIYEEESPMPSEENFYEYQLCDPEIQIGIKKIAWDAFAALNGTGYTRVDVRVDKHTGQANVLEVNAQCGISEDENFTSIGAILKYTNQTFTELVIHIINDAFARRKN